MYQDHFGLQRHLFEEGIAQGVDVFLGAPQRLAVTNLGVALTLRDSVAVLTGPAGVGKTTLAAHTLRSLTTRLALGWVGTAPATGHELLEMLLTEFGFSPYKNSRVERLQMWRQYLNEMRATDTRVCVLVECAENLHPDVLAALESLTAADPNGGPGANVVLTSRTGLTERLSEPALAALRQRTRLRWNLEPLTRVEIRDYLAHCITAAGGKTLKLFTDDALDALHQYSGGIIRTANNLCATALTLAASAREPQVNAPLITQVAVDVFGLAPAAPAGATSWPTVEPETAPKATRPPAPAPTVSAPPVPPRAATTPPPATPAAPRAAPPPPAQTVAPRAAATPPPPPAMPPSLSARPTPAARPSPVASTPASAPSATVAPPSSAAPAPSVAPAATSAPPSTPVAPANAPPRAAVSPPAAASPSTVAPAPTPAPSMAPSQSLAARVAATRAAQAAAAPAQQPTPAMKPAAPPAATAKPAPAQVSTPQVAPPLPAAQVATAAKAPPTKPVLERAAPETAERPASPPRPEPAPRVETKPPSTAAKPEADVPVLTIEFESSPEVASDDEEFSFDLALSAGQIDEVLGNDSPEVPVLTERVDSESDDSSTSASMITEFDEETQHKLANLEALANAKELEDISNSMAETLFGDAELDKLAATLALATSKQDDKSKDGEPAPAKTRTAP